MAAHDSVMGNFVLQEKNSAREIRYNTATSPVDRQQQNLFEKGHAWFDYLFQNAATLHRFLQR
jgi:hypothetical protein